MLRSRITSQLKTAVKRNAKCVAVPKLANIKIAARFYSVDEQGSHPDFQTKIKKSSPPTTEELHKSIEQAIQENPVVLYMKGTPERPECGFSARVVQVLNSYNIKYKTFNMNQDVALKEALKSFSDWPTIPQLYVKGEFVGGCDITMSLHKDGSLKQMLEEAASPQKI